MKRASFISVESCSLGKGIFAERIFNEGDVLFTFRGPEYNVVDLIENYGNNHANAIQIGKDNYIYPEPPGLYINHSCNPNVGIFNERDIVAIEPVYPGDEIRFDYSTTMSEDYWELECHCGEEECRGVVRDFHHLPFDIQRRYLDLGIVQNFIVEEVQQLQTFSERRTANRELMIEALNRGSATRGEGSLRNNSSGTESSERPSDIRSNQKE